MPGTESSESNADKDVQEQLWDDKKVPVERRNELHLLSESQLTALPPSQEDLSNANTCDVPGIK